MTQLQSIAIAILALDGLVLAMLILRTYGRRWNRTLLRGDAPARRTRRDAERLMREMEEWAAGIDQRVSVRLAELRELLQRAEMVAQNPDTGARPAAPITPDDAASKPAPLTAHPTELPPVGAPPHAAGSYASHGEVHRLADSGLEPLAIARRLGRPVGEVELIIKLSARQREAKQADRQHTEPVQ